jgi:hypothetical protein
MTTVHNLSATAKLFGTIWSDPPPPNPGAAWQLDPGQDFGPIASARGLAFNWCLFYDNGPDHNATQQPWWRGRVGASDLATVDPSAHTVSIKHSSFTLADLNRLKALFPENSALQAVTLDDITQQTIGKLRDGSTATLGPDRPAKRSGAIISACHYAEVMLVVDAVFIAMGATGLRKVWNNVDPTWIEHIADVLAPQMTEIERIAMRLSNPATPMLTMAAQVWAIVKLVYTAGLFEAIYKAIMQTLSWWDMILYGVLGLAELTAAFVTDGAEIIVLIVAELALIGFLASDVVKAKDECHWGDAAPA